eukprot:1771370-Rhodomonas_salina.1
MPGASSSTDAAQGSSGEQAPLSGQKRSAPNAVAELEKPAEDEGKDAGFGASQHDGPDAGYGFMPFKRLRASASASAHAGASPSPSVSANEATTLDARGPEAISGHAQGDSKMEDGEGAVAVADREAEDRMMTESDSDSDAASSDQSDDAEAEAKGQTKPPKQPSTKLYPIVRMSDGSMARLENSMTLRAVLAGPFTDARNDFGGMVQSQLAEPDSAMHITAANNSHAQPPASIPGSDSDNLERPHTRPSNSTAQPAVP